MGGDHQKAKFSIPFPPLFLLTPTVGLEIQVRAIITTKQPVERDRERETEIDELALTLTRDTFGKFLRKRER